MSTTSVLVGVATGAWDLLPIAATIGLLHGTQTKAFSFDGRWPYARAIRQVGHHACLHLSPLTQAPSAHAWPPRALFAQYHCNRQHATHAASACKGRPYKRASTAAYASR